MELDRALSDLAEVRDRLAHVQRFEGYSAPASAASGIVAVVAGFVQFALAPHPKSERELHFYLAIWLSCLAAGLLLNYGAVAIWLLKHRGPADQSRFRTAALSIAPSVVLGGVLTVGLLDRGSYALLPALWFAFYAIGLFASYAVIPRATIFITFGFSLLAMLFSITPLVAQSLSWWVMPLGFGLGQIGIGFFLWQTKS
jgi:hypothetical protein